MSTMFDLQGRISIFLLFFFTPAFYTCYGKLHVLNSTLSSFFANYVSSDNGMFVLRSGGEVRMEAFSNFSVVVWKCNEYEFGKWDDNEEVAALELRNDGNLIFYFHNGRVYESFDHPGDVILPNQTLRTGMTFGSDAFHAVVDYNGIIIQKERFSVDNNQAWILGTDCINSTTEVFYTGTKLQFSNGCQKSFTLRTSSDSNARWPYLTLKSSNGDLVSMYYDSTLRDPVSNNIGGWKEDNMTLFQLASILDGAENLKFENPTTAFCNKLNGIGEVGACDENGNCTCLTTGGFRSQDYRFVPDDDYHYISGANSIIYKSTQFMLVFYESSMSLGNTYISCKNSCMVKKPERCMAFLYDNITSQCFFIPGAIYNNATFSISLSRSYHLSDSNDAFLLVLIVPATFLIAWIVSIISLAFLQRRLSFNPAKEIENVLASTKGLPQRFSYASLDTATWGFSDMLGSGGFGFVYKGVLSDGRSVAVKKLNSTTGTHAIKQFVTEVCGMGGISHVNVVKLCGFCIDVATLQCMLVYELMVNGSLDKWIFEDVQHQGYLTWKQRIDIAFGTAKGLNYLHEECSEPILHLDVKPQNILLDESFTSKLADFGMAKLLENRNVTQVHTCMRGTPGYMAPEWLTQFTATKKSDVFSYGMVLLEMIGGRKNIDHSKLNNSNDVDGNEDGSGWYFPAWVVEQVSKGNLIGIVDEKVRASAGERIQELKMIINLALWCIQENPATRPSMQTIVQVFQGILELGPAPSPTTLSSNASTFTLSSFAKESVACSSSQAMDDLIQIT